MSRTFAFAAALMILAGCDSQESAGQRGDESGVELSRLRASRAVNLGAVLERAHLLDAQSSGPLRNPYEHEAIDLQRFERTYSESSAVCAVRFSDAEQIDYELQTFPTARAAGDQGFTVTHTKPCGACSTLRDLAVYLEKPDLTTPVRSCAALWFFPASRVKSCLVEEVGFSDLCADAWTYNVLHTRDQCASTCLADYGLLNTVLGRFPASNNLPDGTLRPCIRCDEESSGTGFRYGAGRLRRNSGLQSAIARRPGELAVEIDHTAYFARE
jgi:hypothetical protein